MKNLRFSVRFQDEGRFGRVTYPKSCWAPKGSRPIAPQQAIREYTYAYASIAPLHGEVDSLILPDMAASTLQLFLDELSSRHLDEYILLVMDGAPSHHAGKENLEIPENIKIVFQPPYSPQVNPVEHLWDEIREKFFANCVFRDMDALEDKLVEALRFMETHPDYVHSFTCFSWMKETLEKII